MSADGRRSPRLVCALAGVVACAALVAPVRPLRTAWAASVSARASAAAAEDRYAAAVRVATAVDDSLVALVAARRARDSVGARPYLVISVADHRLWLRAGDTLRFEAPVATGTGDAVEGAARFATPRGRLVVLRKEDDPLWVPPDWHFEEFAADRGLRLARLDPRRPFRSAAGTLEVVGRDVVLLRPDGSRAPLPPGREIVMGRSVVIPPFGTRQRVFRDVLGPHRLSLGQGYGIHGTNEPSSVGRFASHGCIRMRNADIEALVPLVPVGTPVYIY